MYNLNAIIIFLTVTETQGFTAAGTRLNMPKSKVSRLISQLESQLETRLFERSTRHVRLTEAGEIFYQYARRIFDEAKQAEHSLHSINQTASGLLRISTSISVGQHLLGPVLASFMQMYPDIEIDLEITNRRVDLIEEYFDVAIRVGELPSSSLVAKRIGSSPLKFYASKNYLNQFGIPKNLSNLGPHRVLCMPNSLNSGRLTLYNTQSKKTDDQSGESIELDFVASINDFGTIHRLATDGAGIAILPSFMCHTTEPLQPVLLDWEANRSPLHIVYPSHRGMAPKLRAFIDFMSTHLVKHLQP